MKNDLTCGVVRDLLPSYVEDLLCGDSRQAVDRHLTDCPECAAALSAMRAPEEPAVPADPPPDVDYLKKLKGHGKLVAAAAAACAALVVIAALLYQFFERGTPLNPQSVAITEISVTEVEGYGHELHLSLSSTESGKAFYSWRVATGTGEGIQVGDVGYITAQEVLASPLHPDGSISLDIPLSNRRKEMWLGGTSGRLLWQDGVLISQTALDLMDAKAPYCGDPTALERIADILRLPDRLGRYTIRLQTAQAPYCWTVECANPLNSEQRQTAACFNILALALVDNLEMSQCTYPVSDSADPVQDMADRIYAKVSEALNDAALSNLVEEYNAAHGASWEPKASFKDYAETPADLQRLLLMLDSYYGTDLAAQ